MKEVGVSEIPGPRHNQRITDYFQAVILDAALKIDETSWCSAFMNWCLPREHRTQSALARSFMTVGSEVWLFNNHQNSQVRVIDEEPKEGDICVFFDRTSSYKGHVGMFIAFNQKNTKVLVLGGNQSDQVCYKWFPINGKKLYLRSIRRV